MKIIFILFLLILQFKHATAQTTYKDSLQQQLSIATDDTSRVLIWEQLSKYYSLVQPDSGIYYGQKVVELSQRIKYRYGEALGFYRIAYSLVIEGSFAKALQLSFTSLGLAEQLTYNKSYVLSLVHYEMGVLNMLTNNHRLALTDLNLSLKYGEQSGKINEVFYTTFSEISAVYLKMNKLDSALYYAKKAINNDAFYKQSIPHTLGQLGNVYLKLKNYPLAEKYYRNSLQTGEKFNSFFFKTTAEYHLADLFHEIGHLDTSIYYAKECLKSSLPHQFQLFAMQASSLLTQDYEAQNKSDSTLKYMKLMLSVKDSVFSQEKMQEFQLIAFDEEQRKRRSETAAERIRNQVRTYTLLGVLSFFLFGAILLYRNNKHRKKANELLQQQKEEVQQTLKELRSTQAQLIQSEKMASLGELTAGIAHEIQNPLNFVNNFSEVNTELIDELEQEVDKGNLQEVKAIAKDIKENEEKINHHGKRADAIVKGMLQHSRSSTGVKEPTNINALCDEYLRLSYHGLRAKDKSFNADFKTDLDNSIGKINIIPQDIGRVLLNLINNAFYAVNERQKITKESLPTGQARYQPTVFLSTKRSGDKVILTAKDNGNGIPRNIVDKIFQPFFTTKPTGEGTGLGLSLSYDIIKAHGGEIKVETKEGEGTEFIIQLPA
jgi:two-component system NtrC family sensor kinase